MLTGTLNTAGLPQMDAREKAQTATGIMHEISKGEKKSKSI